MAKYEAEYKASDYDNVESEEKKIVAILMHAMTRLMLLEHVSKIDTLVKNKLGPNFRLSAV